ncbi:bacteriophage spanin2 family protein [Saccharothrix coeruleofusca]|uniref:Lipoprotein n=1 Tax=Saccharothrix coeruleofusca TaxID=33919 RepID=A0A918AU55_9PSEU|nr:bacteriophage spanin2 family protein [Saccharothrix coeruleofusca]MBP2335771.1 hypothetical protein [Saccharothrix coeruleofusca]GGP75242.1 hypothetical protein GCM10010185_56090 [Saccharothrix coeruleofusca]
MRTPIRLTAIAAACTAVVAMSACGAVQEAADTANAVADTATTVQVCADALAGATAALDTAAPERAVDQAHDAAVTLTDLASRAADTTVNEAIAALATTLREVTVQDLVGRPAEWVRVKADQVAALTAACAP